MFERSILKHTGQMWKLWFGAVALTISGAGMVASKMLIDSMSTGLFALTMVGSAVLGLCALAFACITVRCPRCQAPWVWMAVSGQAHSAWLPWLMGLSQCPKCNVTN